MSNLYRDGLLLKFLNPENQPLEVQKYLQKENELLQCHVKRGSLIDVGCGYGRHLSLLKDRLTYGLGIDTDETMLTQGKEFFRKDPHIELQVADAKETGTKRLFDYVICMNNTLGNIEEKETVISEMRRLLASNGTILVAVYSLDSVPARVEWYRRVGMTVKEVTQNFIETRNGFRSYHFSRQRLHQLFGECHITSITTFGYLVRTS